MSRERHIPPVLKLTKLLGQAVTVGVSMFVLSISELSEVGMVRMNKSFISYRQIFM